MNRGKAFWAKVCLGFVLVAAIAWYFVHEQLISAEIRSLRSVKLRAIAIDRAMKLYAETHQDTYPRMIDDELMRVIQREITTEQKEISIEFRHELLIPKIVPVQNREQALKAAQTLGPEEIVYCPILEGDKVKKYFLLCKDKNNELVKVRGTVVVFESPEP